MKHSVFTVAMPEYDVPTAARKLKEWGYDGAEWRVTTLPKPMPDTPSFWQGNRATVDIDNLPDSAEEARRVCEAAGIEIPAIATYVNCYELDAVKRAMEAAKIMGAPMLRVAVPGYSGEVNYRQVFDDAVEQYAKVEGLAREHGLKANFEIHMGNICPSASAAYRLACNFDPHYVGVILDPGNMVYEGMENWQFGIELLGEYLAHVHVKNAKWEIVRGEANGNLVWKPTWATMRGGIVDWGTVIAALRKVGYSGYLSNEDFSLAQPTEEKLKDDLAFLKSLGS